MASLLRRLPWISRPWKPLSFTAGANHTRLPRDRGTEEELIPGYLASRYYPVVIGEVLRGRYQVVGKLGFGASSTVWLARDMESRRHVALKIYITSEAMGRQLDQELSMYRRISERSLLSSLSRHPGKSAVRQLLDYFDVAGPDGSHRCLVHPPLGESVMTFLHRNPVMRLPPVVMAVTLRRLFQALDYLHTECRIIHTDIKGDNILMSITDEAVFSSFEEQELSDPSPRKILDDGRVIYRSRELPMTRGWGPPVLCDLGSAVAGDAERCEDVQPDVYRAPEVILQAPWSRAIDVWNAGCMVWDLFEGGHLFTGYDAEQRGYRSRAHLAEMIALLGDPPRELLNKGKLSHKWFTEEGAFKDGIDLPEKTSLEERESTLMEEAEEEREQGESRKMFLAMMGRMLQWDPSKRASAREMAEDPWIRQFFGKK